MILLKKMYILLILVSNDITNLATNTTLNIRINEINKEIPSITNFAQTAALNAKINGV